MIYVDTLSTDQSFNSFTSFEDFNSTMNFFIGTTAILDGKLIDLNDNEFIRIRTYSTN